VVDGQQLTFEPVESGFRDQQTGSIWDATGRAISGQLAETQLEPVVGIQHFWFSYSAFAIDERWKDEE